MAGRLPSKKPVSLMTAKSAPRRSRLASSHGSRLIRPRLLLALEHEAQVHRQPAGRLEPCLGGREVDVDLALVIGGTAPVDASVLDDRFERWLLPEVERVHRLDVVVAVDDDGGRPLGVEPVAIDDGVAAGLADLDMLDAHPAQPVGDERRGRPDVVAVLTQRGDAGIRRNAR